MRLEKKISAKDAVDFVGTYDPNPIGLNKQKKDLKPVLLK
jgi:hypothetical protein